MQNSLGHCKLILIAQRRNQKNNGATPSGRQSVENPIKNVERPIKIRMIREKYAGRERGIAKT